MAKAEDVDAERDRDERGEEDDDEGGDGEEEGEGGEPELSPEEQALSRAMQETAQVAVEIVPAAGEVAAAQVEAVRARLERVTAAEAEVTERSEALDSSLSLLYARCAAIAIAAGDRDTARGWLEAAAQRAHEAEVRDELANALEEPERFRQLVHGRALFARGKERAARKLWKQLAKAKTGGLAQAAKNELAAPRPLNGKTPSLWSYNGFGLRFSGHRDEWSNGAYATTQCVTALFIPLFPIASYRVVSDGEGWIVIAREQLSAFARAMRYVVLGGIAAVITSVWLHSYLTDPVRVARKRFDRALEVAAERAPRAPEEALRELDAALSGPDISRAGRERARRAGAEVVRLTAGLAPRPLRREHADHATRLVQRYKLLPAEAQGGAAREATVDALEGWVKELGAGADTAETRLALLRLAADVADARRSGPLMAQVSAARLAVADAKAEAAPLEALSILMEQPSADAVERGTKIVARLVEAPSMLADAGPALDQWLASRPEADPLRQAAKAKRDEAAAGRTAASAEEVTPAQLAAMAKQRPWDQYVQLRLARADADGGKLDAAVARLEELGPPALLVRDARYLLAQLSAAVGKLEQADALLSGLLGGRLERFAAASGAHEAARKRAVERIQRDLQLGEVPLELRQQVEGAATDAERSEHVNRWAQFEIAADAAVKKAAEEVEALADVVAVSLTAGTVKLRRAQGLSGAARDAMLVEAERTFLAIRTAAEGQPEFRLGLGEIYARLGKQQESEAELGALLAQKEPQLSLLVARTYRNLGSVERARAIAEEVYGLKPAAAIANEAAVLMAVIEKGRDDDEAAERWYRRADQQSTQVRAALLELEGRRLLRQGKPSECAAKFSASARVYLEGVEPNYNNAALAHMQRFDCSGELSALTDAETALEKAYRESPENPIVIQNLLGMLESTSALRAMGRRIDIPAARFNGSDAELLAAAFGEGPERAAVVADLAADRAARRTAELLAQLEVLAPHSPSPYQFAFAKAYQRRDEAAAAAVLERARRAKRIDTTEAALAREERKSGSGDEKVAQRAEAAVRRYDEALARRPAPAGKTRGAILYRAAQQRAVLGLLKRDAALLARARAEALEAATLWPALQVASILEASLIDEAGLAADAAAWAKLRREHSAIRALHQLAAESSPIAAAIRASKPWGEVAGHMRTDTSRPGLDDLRLARLLGDAELEARAKVVLDDKLKRTELELDRVLDPGDPEPAAALAYLDKR